MIKASSLKKFIRRVLRVVLLTVLGILVLIAAVLLLFPTPAVQNFTRKKIASYLESKLHTRVEIGGMRISLSGKIHLQNIYLEDQHKDTLLSAGGINADIGILKLFHHELQINDIDLDKITVRCSRRLPDSVFNFAYIIDAFSGNGPKSKTKDTSSSFTFLIGDIHLHEISAAFTDDATGNDLFVFIGDLKIRVKKFDPSTDTYFIGDISLSQVQGRVRQYRPLLKLPPKIDSIHSAQQNSSPANLQLGKLALNAINLDYRNDMLAQNAGVKIGLLNVDVNSIDLQKTDIRVNRLELKNTSAFARMNKMDEKIKEKNSNENNSASSDAPLSWHVEVAKMILDSNRLQYDDGNKKSSNSGIDYSHLQVSDFTLHANQVELGTTGYAGNIEQLGLTERSGLKLKKLSGNFAYSDRQIKAQHLYLKTNSSEIKNQSDIEYASVSSLVKHTGDVRADVNFDHSVLSVRDLLLFVPALAPNLKGYENTSFRVNGTIRGQVKNLFVSNFEMTGLKQTVVRASGNIRGLPGLKKLNYDILFDQLTTGKKDVEQIVPAKLIPADIRIPEMVTLKGTCKGDLNQFDTRLQIHSSNGDLSVNGALDLKNKTYDLGTTTDELDLGYLIGQEKNLGKFSLHATAKGEGFDYKTMNSAIHLSLTDGRIKQYEYKNLLADILLKDGKATIQSSLHNNDISFDLHGNVSGLNSKFPAVQLKLQLDTLNPYALHLIKDTIHLKFAMDADFSNTDPDNLQGNMQLRDLVFADHTHHLTTDSIEFVAEKKDSGEDIHFHAEMLDASLTGNYKLTAIAQALQQTINDYYNLPGFKNENISPEQWELRVLVKPSPMFFQYLPAWNGTDTMSAAILFNSQSNELHADLFAPLIQINDQAIHQLQIRVDTKDSALYYSTIIADAGKPGFQIYQSSISGHAANNRLFAALVLRDKKNKERYRIAGNGSFSGNDSKFSIEPDSLLLNYEQWNLSRGNFIHYDSTGLIIHDFKLSNKEQSLSVNSRTSSTNSPIDIAFDNFHIKTISQFAEQDSLLMDGLLNGRIAVRNILSNPAFTSDLYVNNLSYEADTIGNVTVKIDNEQANAFSAHIALVGGNNMNIDGTYYTGEEKMNMKINIGHLNLAVLKAFSYGQLRDIRGVLKGNIQATGSLGRPVLNGVLNFNNAFVTPYLTGETYRLPSETVQFNERGIDFHDFVFFDSAGNKATINGNAYTNDWKDYRLDLTLKAANFRLVNAPKEVNRLFYGRLNIDADIGVTGDAKQPKVNANLRVNKQTDFTVILPSSDPEMVDREGVVRFVNNKQSADTISLRRRLDSVARQSPLKGMDVAATIETDSSAQFTMIVDERNGDALSVRGRAFLAGGIDKSGKTSLTGNYELENGAYNVSLSVLKRKFNIQKRSVITWTGNPTSANMNITATYVVNTASIDLMAQELAGMPSGQTDKYKTKLPFQVNLIMTGELLKPVIKFDITLPANVLALWPDVDAKLQQIRTSESETNKQVFALLLLGRFIQQNPTQSADASADAALIARQSVSSILTDQMNQLAGSLIKGVDLSFDLTAQDDYSTGTKVSQTQLNVGMSKNLFSERVKVTVGSNFQLGDTYQGQSTSNIAGDVSVDYRLSKDGRYTLRVYRKDQYETIVEGQVVETGISFILSFDYNQFRELFQSQKKEKKAEKKTTTDDSGETMPEKK